VPEQHDPKILIVWGVLIVIAGVAFAWALYQVREVLLLIYISGLFAIGFSPLVRMLERQHLLPVGSRRLPRWLAILVIYVAILGTIGGVATAIVPQLVRQAQELWAAMPGILSRFQGYLVAAGVLPQPITLKEAVEHAPAAGGDAVGTVITALWGFVGGVFGVVTILILTFYLLVEADALRSSFLQLFPRRRRAAVARTLSEITVKVSAWLGGQLLLAGIIGTSSAIGLGLLGAPYFFVLALISAIGELIPVVGPILAAIPAVLVAWTESARLAVFVLIFFIAQQQVENHLLVPKVMERQVGVSAVTVIVALLIGGSLLGIVGALLAVPSAAILQVVVQQVAYRDE
jgi:predicted PurR-regulated permease PerM